LPSQEKVGRVSELSERIGGSVALLLTDYRGLTVSDIKEVRRSLAAGGASFSIVKNTLMERAVTKEMAGLLELLTGPTAVAFVSGDPVAVAKGVVDASKKFPALVLKGAFLDGRVLSADDAKALADLESRDVMLSKIAGMIKSEITRAASMFQATQAKFLSVLEAYKEKVPSADEPTQAGDSEPTPAADSETPQPSDSGTPQADENEPVTQASNDGETSGESARPSDAEASEEGKE
jgi:large subunit ribosomal protein L10